MATSFRKKKAEKSQRSRSTANLADFVMDDLNNPPIDPNLMLVVRPVSDFYVDEQVRKTIDPHAIAERAASMRENGQIQPIVVYPADSDGKYKIDKGECRWRAAQLIEGFALKAVIDPEAPKRNTCRRIVGQIVENDQRSELQPLEMAMALDELTRDGMNMEAIARALGWVNANGKPNINKVSRYLSIMKLPEEGRQLVEKAIVTDLITLELLRKIAVIDLQAFAALCELSRRESGLSRKQAEQTYKHCKSTATAATAPKKIPDPSRPSQRQPSVAAQTAPKQAPVVSSEAQALPVIKVMWKRIHPGSLVLDQPPEHADSVRVRLDSGDVISVSPDELRLKAVIVKRA
ncbi:MAG: ParB/RepB/Spo0J family partition protein [Cellvibrionaceae bacterium]|nr:ParB/RepB/Spo0J family partition protein [Cellvibrionaceae bacterium]